MLLYFVWIAVTVACNPESHTICVDHNGGYPGQYLLNTGEGFSRSPEIILRANESYNFQIETDLLTNPFAITISPTGPAVVWLEGVSGSNPAWRRGDVLYWTPNPLGTDRMYYHSVNSMNVGGSIKIINTCIPSEYHICVTASSDPPSFYVDQGEGARQSGQLSLIVGKTYEFEVRGDEFELLPFSLSTVPPTSRSTAGPNISWAIDNRIASAVKGVNPCRVDDETLIFSPDREGPVNLWYFSPMNPAVGGQIVVRQACKATKFNICVYLLDKQYRVDDGLGEKANKRIFISAEEEVRFKVVGEDFAAEPFLLSSSASSPIPWTQGVRGSNPASQSDASLIFVPPSLGPSVLYYRSLNGLRGGQIFIKNACQPTRSTICVYYRENKYLFRFQTGAEDKSAETTRLLLEGRKRYTFEAVGPEFAEFPFKLMRPTENEAETPSLSQDEDKLVYFPALNTPPEIMYQSINQGSSKGIIFLKDVCQASEYHLCVLHDGGDPGSYVINDGVSEIVAGEIWLKWGKVYTFEVVGDVFQAFPFALTEDSEQAKTPITLGVSGNNPCEADDQRLVLDTATFLPYTIRSDPVIVKAVQLGTFTMKAQGYSMYYQSIVASGLGGKINVYDPATAVDPVIAVDPVAAVDPTDMGNTSNTSASTSTSNVTVISGGGALAPPVLKPVDEESIPSNDAETNGRGVGNGGLRPEVEGSGTKSKNKNTMGPNSMPSSTSGAMCLSNLFLFFPALANA